MFEHALVLLLLVTGLGVVARWLPWPGPITHVLGGLGCALIPAMTFSFHYTAARPLPAMTEPDIYCLFTLV